MLRAWWRSSIIPRRSSESGVAVAIDLLNAFDGDAVPAARRVDVDLVADTVTDQRLAQRRLIADPTCLGVRLRGADDPVLLLVGAVLREAHCAAHPHDAFFGAGLDDHVVLDDGLELIDPSLHHPLLVLRSVVLEVLREVSQLARGLDLGHD